MKAEITGLPELKKALELKMAEINQAAQSVLAATALAVEADAIKSIQRGSKTGITYTRGKIKHKSSAPGEAPATDTGELVESIRSVIGQGEAAVGTDKDYGIWLEFGTRSMAERPWLRPAKAKNQSRFRKQMLSAIRATTK